MGEIFGVRGLVWLCDSGYLRMVQNCTRWKNHLKEASHQGLQAFAVHRQWMCWALQAVGSLSPPCSAAAQVEVVVFQENVFYKNRPGQNSAPYIQFARLWFILVKRRHQLPINSRWDSTSTHVGENQKIILLERKNPFVYVQVFPYIK